MKRIIVISAMLYLAYSFFPVFAFDLPTPFGGRINSVKMPPNVTCPGDFSDNPSSPFYISPVGKSSSGPYSRSVGRINVGKIVSGAWILGFYRPASNCVQENGPEANPYPTLETNFYGTSAVFKKN